MTAQQRGSKMRKGNRLNRSDLTLNGSKVLECILATILKPIGLDNPEDVESTITLMEAGYVALITDGKGCFWLEPTIPIKGEGANHALR